MSAKSIYLNLSRYETNENPVGKPEPIKFDADEKETKKKCIGMSSFQYTLLPL